MQGIDKGAKLATCFVKLDTYTSKARTFASIQKVENRASLTSFDVANATNFDEQWPLFVYLVDLLQICTKWFS